MEWIKLYSCLILIFMIVTCKNNDTASHEYSDEFCIKLVDQAIKTGEMILWLSRDCKSSDDCFKYKLLFTEQVPSCDFDLIYHNIYLLDEKEYYSALKSEWVSQSDLPQREIKWLTNGKNYAEDYHVTVYISNVFIDNSRMYFSADFIKFSGESRSVWIVSDFKDLISIIPCGFKD